MRWLAVVGSGPKFDRQIETDVRKTVTEAVEAGDGIVSGGGLGVDQIAIAAAIAASGRRKRLKVILPTPLEVYTSYCRQQASEGRVDPRQAEELVAQLERVRAIGRAALIEMDYEAVSPDSIEAKNQAVVDLADHLLAFGVDQDPQTESTISRAEQRSIPTTVKRYQADDRP